MIQVKKSRMKKRNHMKNSLSQVNILMSTIVLVVTVTISPSIVQAVDYPVRPALMEARQEVKTERQDRRAVAASVHATQLEKRFGEYFSKLSNLFSRIEQRANTLKSQGKNVDAVLASVAKGKAALAEAQSLGAEAIRLFKAIDPAKYAEQRAQALQAKEKAEAARKKFQEALQAARQAIAQLKTASGE